MKLGSSGLIAELASLQVDGRQIGAVEVEVYRLGDRPVLVEEYRFDDAYVTKLQVDAMTGQVALEFAPRTYLYQYAQNAGDSALDKSTAAKVVNWDAEAMVLRSASGTSFRADALDRNAIKSGDSPVESLRYYLRVAEGATLNSPMSTWMALDGFAWGTDSESTHLNGIGGGVAKTEPQSVRVSLGSTPEMAFLTSQMLQGKSMFAVDVVATRATAQGQTVVESYQFRDAYVTQLASAGGAKDMSLVFE